jgi:uncharacterized protein (DUF736 family)
MVLLLHQQRLGTWVFSLIIILVVLQRNLLLFGNMQILDLSLQVLLMQTTNGTDANTPQLSVTTFAPIEIGALWVTDCAGTSQVISCTGTERFLENITVDAGTF